MSTKRKGEEKVMYLLRDSPTPMLDCLVERIHHEKARRLKHLLPPLQVIYLRNTCLPAVLAELKLVKKPMWWFERFYGVRLVMFYATVESEQLYPECSVLFFAINQLEGKGYGL